MVDICTKGKRCGSNPERCRTELYNQIVLRGAGCGCPACCILPHCNRQCQCIDPSCAITMARCVYKISKNGHVIRNRCSCVSEPREGNRCIDNITIVFQNMPARRWTELSDKFTIRQPKQNGKHCPRDNIINKLQLQFQ